MLCRMAFHLSGKVVALPLDNSTAKAYLCNQGITVSPFLSRLACQILSLTDKHGIILLPAYIPTHLNVEADYLSWDQLLLEWHLLPQVAEETFHLWGLPEVDLWHLLILLNASIISLWKHNYLWGLGVECLQPSLDFSGKLLFLPLALVPLALSKFLAEHVNSQLRHLILVAPCWMEAPWLPTVHNMLADVPWLCPIVKDLIMDVSVGQALKGL